MILESVTQALRTVFDHVMASANDLDATVWIALGSMAAALVAASEAVRNRRIASRMYDIAVREHLRTETPLEVYLADSRILHVTGQRRRVYVFELLITNRSAAPSSIKQLSLALTYDQQSRPASNLAVQHDPEALEGSPKTQAGDVLSVPRPIRAGEAISGIALFPVADSILDGAPIEMYTVKLLDAHERAAECQAILMREFDL